MNNKTAMKLKKLMDRLTKNFLKNEEYQTLKEEFPSDREFLALLDKSPDEIFAECEPMDEEFFKRIQKLCEGIDVDIDEPLKDDDKEIVDDILSSIVDRYPNILDNYSHTVYEDSSGDEAVTVSLLIKSDVVDNDSLVKQLVAIKKEVRDIFYKTFTNPIYFNFVKR